MNPFPFDNRFLKLGEHFYQKCNPVPVEEPRLIIFNGELAEQIGIATDVLGVAQLAAIFSGNRIPEGAAPLAMAYAGHQFGHYNPSLGDGRAILLGELRSTDGRLLAMQLKGSGRTRYSRGGDGRAALGPVLREYLLSEAMNRLGVPSTRALAAVSTGEWVQRTTRLPGAIITRIAESFIRVGTFQYHAVTGDTKAVRQLADFVIEHNYPEAVNAENPYIALLTAVIDRQAALIARWMQLGFIHGVMNTDNMSVTGETIDYGPCAFMDHFDHQRVFSSIDREGRYAYGNQPGIGLWNLTRLAETLLPLLHQDSAKAVDIARERLDAYAGQYQDYWLDGMRRKMGLPATAAEESRDQALVEQFLDLLAAANADFTQAFRQLSELGAEASERDRQLFALFDDETGIHSWVEAWRRRIEPDDAVRQQRMRAHNPIYIPRNHLVEAAIRAAEDQGDLQPFHDLHQVLQHPYRPQPGREHYGLPPAEHEIVRQTFCGT